MPNFTGQSIPGGLSQIVEYVADQTALNAITAPMTERIYTVLDIDGTGRNASFTWDGTAWQPVDEGKPETITSIATPTVDAVTDPNNPVVTIAYNNEDRSQAPVNFTIPLPTPVSVVNSIDLKPSANPNEFVVEIVYTNDQGIQTTITDATPVDLSGLQGPWDNPDGTPATQVSGDIEYNDGALKLGEYGQGNYDDPAPARFLAVDASGNVVETIPPATCPDPMTRAQLRALRTSGGLSKDCHYVVTDYNRGSVGAATLLLHAVDDVTLSQSVDVRTAFDNTAWAGRYDIDTNRLLELSDNIGNKVSGQEIVDTFPWGDTAVYDNTVEEGATLTYTDGAFFDNVIRSAAIVVINNTGSGNFSRNVIGEDSNVTWTAGDFRDNVVDTNGVVNHASTGDFDNNVVSSLGRVDTSGTANVDQVTVRSNSRLSISGGSLSQSSIMGESSVTLVSGDSYDITVDNSSTINQVGTGILRATRVQAESTVAVGDVNFQDNVIERSVINTTGSTGSIRYSSFKRATINGINVASLTLDSVSFAANSQMTVTGATRTYVRYTTMSGYGRILQSAGTQLDMNYDGIRDYAYVQVLNGRLYSQYNSLSNVSYIQNNTTGTNRAERNSVSSQAYIRFIGTSNNCRVYYSTISSGSNIQHQGTSTGCYFYYCEVTSASSMYSNNSVNLRAYYNTASGNSQYYSINVTATHYAYYNAASAHGYIRHNDSTGGRIYAVHCSGQGLLNLVGATPSGRIYYSSFSAFYYLTASNWTVTRTALHGYGRRSYTVTNPPNGAYTQNF